MERNAKLFRTGRNQAVRLPMEFEFDTSQVYIRRDEQGNVILSKQPFETDSWQPLLAMLQNVVVPGNFLAAEDRLQGMIERDPFNNRF
ncbi:antitoxin [Serratia fonticola]|uniref:antitoxin n=1 Tax=Serratia fonticola TaxID=47917 RepID=UPI00217C83A5|nr:AbrB/MazE/SpoVT family DNA-binding domain-containing protein [Serratia fonticola]CAI0966945.1 Antitoxin VapB1 [Serratia fonticola]CAI1503955.1 Antitoxin VapB1 [Serratia fonticola]CAI1844560.1 Antitoxin VapB1 [Serratia fonticola]CAI2473709.1 Antitoxin VapB1 [Serratia fonticola]